VAESISRTKTAYWALFTMGSLLSVTACDDPGPPGDGDVTTATTETTDETTDGTTGVGTSACGAADAPFRVVASADDNMTLTSDLRITEVAVAGSSTEITFDWSGLTKDIYGHPWDPTKIVQVALVPWKADIATVQAGINVDDPLLESLTDLPGVFNPQASGSPVTSAKITDFTDVGGAPIKPDDLNRYLDPANGFTITLILQEDTQIGVDARMIQAFKPTAGATATAVTITDTSTTLSATAVFGAPVLVPAGVGGLSFNYGGLTTRSFGGEFTSKLFQIIIGKYPLGTDLEKGILDIDYAFENFWRGPAPGVGTTLDLSTLKDGTGASFAGVDANSQYLLGIVCPSCTNPSPWYLTELVPCP
jgi:hypothetical protein